jgi:hypothetical protein
MRFFKLIFPISALLCFIITASAQGANWVYIGENESVKEYYDSDSITVTESGTKTLWFKDIYSDFGRNHVVMDRMQRFQPTIGYEFLSFGVEQFELNCKTREYRLIARISYDRNGGILDSFTFNKKLQGWSPIVPESFLEMAYFKVCRIPTKK